MEPNFQRLEAVLWREQPDHVPLYEHLVDGMMMQAILHRPAPHFHAPGGAEKAPDGKKEERLRGKKAYLQYLWDFFGGLGYDYIPFEIGMNLFRLNVAVSNREEPLGRTSRGWVDDSRSTIANMEEFEEYPWPTPETAIDYELLEAADAILPPKVQLVSGVAGGVQEHVLQLVGLNRFSRALHTDKPFVQAMFDKIGELIEGVDKIIAEYRCVGAMRMGDDMGYKTETTLSPKILRTYVFPWHKKIATVAHRAGKPFILHSCGNLTEVIDDLINYVRIDAWHSFQDIVIPVTTAKDKYGDKVAILGGVDLDVLTRGTLPEVEQKTKAILDHCKKGGGYALGSGNSIPNYIKVENYLAMLEIGKKYGGY
jgi:uroporphyrinogen decarboxylase